MDDGDIDWSSVITGVSDYIYIDDGIPTWTSGATEVEAMQGVLSLAMPDCVENSYLTIKNGELTCGSVGSIIEESHTPDYTPFIPAGGILVFVLALVLTLTFMGKIMKYLKLFSFEAKAIAGMLYFLGMVVMSILFNRNIFSIMVVAPALTALIYAGFYMLFTREIPQFKKGLEALREEEGDEERKKVARVVAELKYRGEI